MLNVLDATSLCARQPIASEAWALAVLLPARPEPPDNPPAAFSWFSLARNPQALLLTGVITAGLVRDAVARAVSP